MDDRKFWLTGSSGLVGRSIHTRFKKQGLDVLNVTNQKVSNYAGDNNPGPTHREYIDDYRPEQIEETCNRFGVPEVLIHTGWGGMTDSESQIHLNENVKNSFSLMSTLYRLGLKKFIFLGSINEYGQRGGRLSEEMEPQGKLRNYELGKRRVGELGVCESKKWGAVYIHVRLANTFGAPQRADSLIGTLHQAYTEGVPAKLSACEDYRDYIHAFEVAEGVFRICEVDFSTTVNLGCGKSTQLRWFVEKYWATLGGDTDSLLFGAIPQRKNEPDQPKPFLDISKLKDLTHWRPTSTMEEGIKKTVIDMRSWEAARLT